MKCYRHMKWNESLHPIGGMEKMRIHFSDSGDAPTLFFFFQEAYLFGGIDFVDSNAVYLFGQKTKY